MKNRVRKPLLLLAGLFVQPMRLVPWPVRKGILRGLLFAESRINPPRVTLAHLFAVLDDVDRLLSERATAYGNGTHPKHRLTGYHDFFVSHIPPGASVLDIGCGIGAVARSIAEKSPLSKVVGIDSDPLILAKAEKAPRPNNLSFQQGDATQRLPAGSWDVIVLSNVLEHIESRIDFLRSVLSMARPRLVLVRVPLFERHWHMPLRRELGVDFRSDPTHHIEHRLDEFRSEVEQAGLRVLEQQILWGEIWAKLEPVP